MSMPIPDVPVAAGYTVRALGDVEEFPARSLVCGKRSMPMSQTIVMKVGTGITTSSARRSTARLSRPTQANGGGNDLCRLIYSGGAGVIRLSRIHGI
jgi:hypothetical protein